MIDEESTYISVFSSSDTGTIEHYSLVLSAVNISHRISRDGTNWHILVKSENRLRAEFELQQYSQENQGWPLRSKHSNFAPDFKALSLLISGCLLLFYTITGPWSEISPWFLAGSINSEKILHQYEYLRLFTALTLHADLVHLFGNCLIGGFVLHFHFHTFGNGIGLASLLSSAISANFINVYSHGPGHYAVGFSTALFAVIGMLCAANYRHYKFNQPMRYLAPLGGGAALLAMLGSGGVRTDLGAHFFGLLCGIGWGIAMTHKNLLKLRTSNFLQLSLTLFSGLVIFFSWYLALKFYR